MQRAALGCVLMKPGLSSTDACSARHFQTIWLLAQGHTIEEAAETTCFVPRWIEELLARHDHLVN
jgi:hypothetical protein